MIISKTLFSSALIIFHLKSVELEQRCFMLPPILCKLGSWWLPMLLVGCPQPPVGGSTLGLGLLGRVSGSTVKPTLLLATLLAVKLTYSVGWHHWLNGHEFEQAPRVGDEQGSLACCSPWGHKELDTAERLNNKILEAIPYAIKRFQGNWESIVSWVKFVAKHTFILAFDDWLLIVSWTFVVFC